MQGKSSKYRQSALDYLERKRALNTRFKILSAKAWTLWIIIFIIICSTVSYLFFGSLRREFYGKGLLVNSDNTTYVTKDLVVVGYISADKGKRVSPGMPVRIFPLHLEGIEHGSLFGQIQSISQYPVTEHDKEINTKNANIESIYTSSMLMMKVVITLLPDENTPSGYRWTSGKGSPKKITAGTLVNFAIITKKLSPMHAFFPTLFKNTSKEE